MNVRLALPSSLALGAALLAGPVAAFEAHLAAADLPERVLGRRARESPERP